MVSLTVTRGTIYYILVWISIWFSVNYGQAWFFESVGVKENGYRALTFIVIAIVLFIVIFSVTKES